MFSGPGEEMVLDDIHFVHGEFKRFRLRWN